MALGQRIERSDGSTRTVPLRATLRYVRSTDHSHWHVLGFMRYELRGARRRRGPSVTGRRGSASATATRRARAARPVDDAALLRAVRQGGSQAPQDPGGDLGRLGRQLHAPPRGTGARDHLARRPGATCWCTASTRAATSARATTATTRRRWRSTSSWPRGRTSCRRGSTSSPAARTRRSAPDFPLP